MSWAEDNNIDSYSCLDGVCADGDVIEDNWNRGFHIDRNEKEHNLKEMTDSHLRNTIAYFKEKLDTSALEKELAGRKKLSITIQ